MSLNSVVNKLVRAAASVPEDISDADLDAHVARLLAAEAKSNDAKWAELGLGAYLNRGARESDSPDPSLPKPNKRFLASVIRTVDGHNQALLRNQAQAASGARDRAESRRERGASGASRLFGGALASMGRGGSGSPASRSGRDSGRDSGRGTPLRDRIGRDSGTERERERGSDIDKPGSSRRDSSPPRERERDRRERSPDTRRRDNGRKRDDYDSDDRSGRDRDRKRRYSDSEDDYASDRRKGKDRDRRDDRMRRDRGDDCRARDSDDERRRRGKEKDRRRDRSSSRDRDRRKDDRRQDKDRDRRKESRRDRDRDDDRRRSHRDASRSPKCSAPSAPPPPPDSPPRPPSDNISRMDKYFHKNYDPRLDVGAVPRSGPVADVGWDSMLTLLKEKGKKRRRNSPSLSDSPEPEKRDRIGPARPPPTVTTAGAVASADMKTLMEMEYTRKGGVREWDKGKET